MVLTTNLLVLCRHHGISSAFYLVILGSDRELGHREIKVKMVREITVPNLRHAGSFSRGVPVQQKFMHSVSAGFGYSCESKALLQIPTSAFPMSFSKLHGEWAVGEPRFE